MGARTRLNQAFFTGSLLLAGAAGWLTQSWMVGLLALTVLLAANLYQGEIRPRKRNKRWGTAANLPTGSTEEEKRHEEAR
jgi:hypothetical protein